MTVSKVVDTSNNVVPLIAALPFEITIEREDAPFPSQESYDPGQQRTIYAGKRDYSTSRENDSAGGLFSTKADTKKDD
jgi:hypothetical protein